jgi:hypothetical protein
MTSNLDDDATVTALNARLARVTARHEEAIVIRNRLARFTEGRIWTDRYPGQDVYYVTMDQRAAADLARLLTEKQKKTAREAFKTVLFAITRNYHRPKER